MEAVDAYLGELKSDLGRVRSLTAWSWIQHTTRSLHAHYAASSTRNGIIQHRVATEASVSRGSPGDLCTTLYLRNNGQGHMSSFKVRQACTLGRKPNVGGSLMLYCGLLGLVRNGGCSQPNMVIGTASINASPAGVNAEL